MGTLIALISLISVVILLFYRRRHSYYNLKPLAWYYLADEIKGGR